MKHLNKIESKASETKLYRVLIGAVLFVASHLTETAMAIDIAVMFFLINSFDKAVVPFNITMICEIICGLLLFALVKIKMLEGGEK